MINDQLNILHISDLHWSKSNRPDRKIVIDALVSDIRKMANSDVIPDLVVFSGDLVQAGDDQYVILEAWENFIEVIAKETAIPMERIFVCPGNHDISRNSVREYPSINEIFKSRLVSTAEINAFIDESKNPSKEIEFALQRVENFYSVHDTYHLNSISQTPFLRSFKISIKGLNIGVACFNTAWRATGESDDVDKNNLLIGERVVDLAANELTDCDYRIAVHHHPFDWLVPADKSASEPLIRKQFDLVCCGHMHLSEPSKIYSGRGKYVMSQAGSIYSGRQWANGYNFISMDIPSRSHKFMCRKYNDSTREYECETRVGEGGIVFLPGAELSEVRKIDRVQLFLRANRSSLREQVANQLNIIGDSSIGTDQLIEQFVSPPIEKKSDEVEGYEKSQDKRTVTFSVAEIIDLEKNILILGDRQSGKTSLAHFIAYEIACTVNNAIGIPVVIDLKGFKFSEYGILKAINNYHLKTPDGWDHKDGLNEGLFIFIIDNLNCNENDVKELAKLIERYNKCRWIVLSTPNFDAMSPERLFNEHLKSFERFYIRELNRKNIRRVAKHWSNGSEDSADRIYEIVMRQIINDGLPKTPYMVSLLVWVAKKKLKHEHLNEASILELITDHLIGKADFRQTTAGTFGPKHKILTLQHIAELLLNNSGAIEENDLSRMLMDFFSNKRLQFAVSDVLEQLIVCGILKRNNDVVSFKYPAFQEYFFAKKLQTETRLLAHYLNGLNFLKIRREIELLAGIRHENEDIINAIALVLNKRTPEKFKQKSVDEFENYGIAKLSLGTTQAELNKIREERISKEQYDEMMDEVDRRALSRGERPVTESLERADGDPIAAGFEREAEAIAKDETNLSNPISPYTHMAAIDTMARITRNSDFSDYTVKASAIKMIVESWTKIYLIVLQEINEIYDELRDKADFEILEEQRDALNYLYGQFLFGSIGQILVANLSSPSLNQTLRAIYDADADALSIGERLLYLFLLEDSNESNWQKSWQDLILDKKIPAFIIDCSVSRLRNITKSKALDEDQSSRVRSIVDALKKRMGWSNNEKNKWLQSIKATKTVIDIKQNIDGL